MIVIWSVVAVVLTALLVILVIALNVNGELHFRLPFVESRVIAAMEKDADEFDSVEIRWKAGDVTITPSADEKMRLTQRSRYDVQELECTVENGRLMACLFRDWFPFLRSGTAASHETIWGSSGRYDQRQHCPEGSHGGYPAAENDLRPSHRRQPDLFPDGGRRDQRKNDR